MGYRVYHKVYCDVPGCDGKGAYSPEQPMGFLRRSEPVLSKGDVIRPQSWVPGRKIYEPIVPSGWRYEQAGLYGLWICPKHTLAVTIDGQPVKDIMEDRETYFKLRGQA